MTMNERAKTTGLIVALILASAGLRTGQMTRSLLLVNRVVLTADRPVTPAQWRKMQEPSGRDVFARPAAPADAKTTKTAERVCEAI
jgi:hypothetical protein